MPGPSGSQKSVIDALTNTYSDVAKMMLLPDAQAHMKFLSGLQQGIMQYIQMAAKATTQPQPGGQLAGMGGPGGGIGMPGMTGGPGGGPPPGPMQPAPGAGTGGGGGMGGLMGAAQQIPPDVMKQLAGAAGQ